MHPITRRQAIRHLGALGAAVSFLPNQAFYSPPEEKLGVALVGLGNYATRQLGPALRHTRHCELRGIVTGTPEKEGKWQEEYGISPDHTYNYQTFDRLADDPAIDIIYIVLPNFMHAEYTIRALKTGKHVICEKPMAMNVAECRAMIEAAETAGKKLQIGYRLFYEPHHLELMRRSLEPSDRGIKLIEASLGFDMARPGMWRIDKEKGGGGALMDLGPYAIQAARRAAGSKPVRVTAQAFKDDPELYKEIFGTYSWQLDFEDNTICNSTVSFSAFVDRLHVARGNQYLEISPAFNASAELALRSRTEEEQFPVPEYQQIAQMDAFAKNIMDDTQVVASGEEGLIDMQIIEAIKASIDEKQTMEIEIYR